MARTDNYRQQHNDLLEVATQISGKLNAQQLSEDASEVRRLLSTLLGKLRIHLATEDKALYPQLLSSTSDDAKHLAKRFIDEIGGIGEVVGQYSKKWSSPLHIQKDSAAFVSETKSLFGALANRIEKENNELYDYVDKM
ncbi:MAG: hemerythrin domain-containing protein [Calditrichaeota bacterium]|nr:MAG: hemerythrin domain-containing protein [Calditrichota bacterium]MBL1205650.1 hemerythrin domain-containing protein [Calditrichota bacterium]NOG45478.1 hemerythrin domain-containing protein [Calditrichota bacterium]